jgi:hypothetical protein
VSVAANTKDRLAALRLASSHLIGPPLASPEAAVAWFGAVQAQDFAGAKWALAQRIRNCDDACVDAMFQRGAILRTHVLRSTWHFVHPADVRFMLQLSRERVKRVMAPYDRKLDIDAPLLRKSHRTLEKSLAGGRFLTREELAERLAAAGIQAAGQRLAHLAMHAELDGLIVSGPRRGKQFTYALLEERVPSVEPMEPEAALAALAARYFQSHGPATPHDFAWWASLTVTDAKRALASAGKTVSERAFDTGSYFGVFPRTNPSPAKPVLRLLPNYDEYVIALKDYGPVLDSALRDRIGQNRHVLAQHLIVLDGLVVGGWRRELDKSGVRVEATLLTPLSVAAKKALRSEAERFAHFLGRPLTLVTRVAASHV